MEDNNNIITSSAKYDKRGYCYAASYFQERKINLITEGLEPLYTKG